MKILAVDYGDARTGLAICDAGELLASPVGVIHSHHMDEVVQKATEAAREQRAERIVVGNPINMNGTRGPRSELCQEFAAKLEEAAGLPVVQHHRDGHRLSQCHRYPGQKKESGGGCRSSHHYPGKLSGLAQKQP